MKSEQSVDVRYGRASGGEFIFNPRYARPSEEVIRNLRESQQMAELTPTRNMYCPVCHFKVAIVPVDQSDIVYVRCRKCKFEGALHPAFFRTSKKCRMGERRKPDDGK